MYTLDSAVGICSAGQDMKMAKIHSPGKSEDLTVVTTESTTFWDMMPYSLVEIYRLSEEPSQKINSPLTVFSRSVRFASPNYCPNSLH
jgi:hypothetical protein